MTEIPPIGDMRTKMKELPFTPLQIKELADLIPKPENHFHYEVKGEWQPNREVYRVNEGDKVVSDYSFPEKSDMTKVQFATRKTYTKELNMWGKLADKPVKYDRKSGEWKKLNLFDKVKNVFHKEINIPAQVVTTTDMNGKEVSVLHTLENKRPVGENVKEAKIDTVKDAQIELALKYKHVDHSLIVLKAEKRQLEKEVSVSAATTVVLERELFRARQEIRNLNAQAMQKEAAVNQANKEAQPGYTGPIYTKPNPNDVVEGKIVG